jgi:hypothetical protein
MLLKIVPFALHTSPLSVQALQRRSCLSYVSYATTVRVTLLLAVYLQPVSLDAKSTAYNILVAWTAQKTPFLCSCLWASAWQEMVHLISLKKKIIK